MQKTKEEVIEFIESLSVGNIIIIKMLKPRQSKFEKEDFYDTYWELDDIGYTKGNIPTYTFKNLPDYNPEEEEIGIEFPEIYYYELLSAYKSKHFNGFNGDSINYMTIIRTDLYRKIEWLKNLLEKTRVGESAIISIPVDITSISRDQVKEITEEYTQPIYNMFQLISKRTSSKGCMYTFVPTYCAVTSPIGEVPEIYSNEDIIISEENAELLIKEFNIYASYDNTFGIIALSFTLLN